MKEHIGFVGLGKMGSCMSRCLLRSGRGVLGWDPNVEGMDVFAATGGTRAGSLSAIGAVSVVITMVWDDAVTEAVVFGEEGLLQTLAPGAIHVAMGTISPNFSERLQRAHQARGQRYLAAPVFGRPEAAANAALNIMCSGDREVFDQVAASLRTMGTVQWIGPDPGQANLMKVVGNNMIFASIQLLGEMFAVLRKAGIAEEHAQTVIVDRLFGGPIFNGYAHRIRERQWLPPAGDFDLAKKDSAICLETAATLGVNLPLFTCMAEQIGAARNGADRHLDISAFAKRVFDACGLNPPD